MIISVTSNRLMALFKRITNETIYDFKMSEQYLILACSNNKVQYKKIDLSSLENFAKSFQAGFIEHIFNGKVVAIDLGYQASVSNFQSSNYKNNITA
jgi:hypothetical protein